MRILTLIVCLILPALAVAEDRAFRLALPETLTSGGFDKHVLTRFKFKHRISVSAVAPGAEADAALLPDGEGARVFQDGDGTPWRIVRLTAGDADVKTFMDWLKSAPGKAAIETYAPEGTPIFTTEVTVTAAPEAEVFEGDEVDGARLSLVHCGRCHVVDDRNRMGGIGSAPSFAAMRARSNWSDLFRAFWSHNPHPSFTQVEGLTEPFDPDRAINIAPVEITPDEIEAITAFVATMAPKNLGNQVQSSN